MIRGPGSLTNVNGTLYFSANDGISGEELWTSDGTEAGTVMVADLAEGSGGSNPGYITEVAGKLFFTATGELHGRELWVSDLGAPNDDRNQDGVIDVRDSDAISPPCGTGLPRATPSKAFGLGKTRVRGMRTSITCLIRPIW